MRAVAASLICKYRWNAGNNGKKPRAEGRPLGNGWFPVGGLLHLFVMVGPVFIELTIFNRIIRHLKSKINLKIEGVG
jgi:hypothetical protein